MKNIYLALILVTALGSGLNAALPPVFKTVLGPAKYSDKTIQDVSIMGPLTAERFNAQKIVVFGPARITDNSKVETAEIFGPLRAESTEFNGPITVYGPVNAKKSTFHDTLTVYSDIAHIELTDVNAKNIMVKITPQTSWTLGGWAWSWFKGDKKPESKIVLLDKTTVESITFEGGASQGNALVMLAPTAQIKGKVTGADVKKIENKK